MSTQEIIREVVKIILKHAKPERIYLFGSHATGEATDTSDIDIAYDDATSKNDGLIANDVAQLKTLVKIDVKNLAHTDERFQNRVRSTGRVLYSATKELRAEDGLYNFNNVYERFSEAIRIRNDLEKEGFGDIYCDLIIKRFEFTYEMSWKAIKRYLSFVGIECTNPRACFKEAFAQGIIADENIWLDMLETRNISSHVYSEEEIKGFVVKMKGYETAFAELKGNLENLLPSQP